MSLSDAMTRPLQPLGLAARTRRTLDANWKQEAVFSHRGFKELSQRIALTYDTFFKAAQKQIRPKERKQTPGIRHLKVYEINTG